MITLSVKDDLAIISLGNGENRINAEFIKQMNKLLDDVEENSGISALICTAEGKFFSNGVDLENIMTGTGEEIQAFWIGFHCLICRILCFPMPTIVALNGHAFAGGCFFSLAFDIRLMNSTKGWISANEVYMPSRIPAFLMNLFREVLPSNTVRVELLALGKRFTAEQALSCSLVQATAPAAQLMERAQQIARERLQLGPLPREGCRNIKLDMYKDLIPTATTAVFCDQAEIVRPKL